MQRPLWVSIRHPTQYINPKGSTTPTRRRLCRHRHRGNDKWPPDGAGVRVNVAKRRLLSIAMLLGIVDSHVSNRDEKVFLSFAGMTNDYRPNRWCERRSAAVSGGF
jgi:hypothetical protein